MINNGKELKKAKVVDSLQAIQNWIEHQDDMIVPFQMASLPLAYSVGFRTNTSGSVRGSKDPVVTAIGLRLFKTAISGVPDIVIVYSHIGLLCRTNRTF